MKKAIAVRFPSRLRVPQFPRLRLTNNGASAPLNEFFWSASTACTR